MTSTGPSVVGNLGEFSLRVIETRSRSGQTVKKVPGEGRATIYSLVGEGLRLEIGVTSWTDGTREVGCLSRLDSPQAMDRLVHGFRLGIEPVGPRWKTRLRTPKIGSRQWPTPHQTSLQEVAELSGLHLPQALAGHAAVVGSAAEVLNAPGRFRNDLYIIFDDPDLNSPVPAIAYSVVVAIPMYRGYAS